MKSQITIIIAILNASQTLHKCLNSVINQTHQDKELIVIDGGSTDGSLSIINSYKNYITHFESKPDRGIYHAWNKALVHAHGSWVCFLGGDDFFWSSTVLSDLVSHLQYAETNNIRLVYGQMAKIDQGGKIVRIRGKKWDKIRWQMPHGMPIELPHPGLMHHCQLFDTYGKFDESFSIAGDYEFLLRWLKYKKNQALYVPQIRTVGSQIGGIADSESLLAFKEVAKARKKNGFSRLSWMWFLVYMRGILRKIWQKLPVTQYFKHVSKTKKETSCK